MTFELLVLSVSTLEHFFPKHETEFVALLAEDFGEDRVAAVEDGDPAFPLLPDLGEHFVPVGAAGNRPRLEARDQIAFFLGSKN